MPIINPYPNTSHSHTHTWNPAYVTYPVDYINPNINPTIKEEPMSTIQQVQQERRDKIERARVEAAYEAWDEEFASDDATTTFTFKIGEKRHAAVLVCSTRGRARWSVTHGPNEVPEEDLLGWLIGKDITPEDITWLK